MSWNTSRLGGQFYNCRDATKDYSCCCKKNDILYSNKITVASTEYTVTLHSTQIGLWATSHIYKILSAMIHQGRFLN